MKLRQYQIQLSNKATDIIKAKNIVCLFMEVRTGKTLTALQICDNINANNVLFITKIKAFDSIKSDHKSLNYPFNITVINRESLHKIKTDDFDVVIIDEVHGYSAYPRASKYQKDIKKRFGHLPMVLLSGTPTPESYSQFYHIFDLSMVSPFAEYKNFYEWAYEFVDIELRYLAYAQVNDYSNARKDDFWHLIKDYILTFTQVQAGFNTNVNENILYCKMKPLTYQLINKLHKELIITSKDGRQIIADTSVKLQQKMHQIFSGTVKFEDGSVKIIDTSKGYFIKNRFRRYRMAIFYKFKAELEMLKEVFGDMLTTDLKTFNNTNKNIALQIVSGREGISLKKADYLVFLNIDFSAVSYFQAKDRLTTIDRKTNDIYWIFSENGIEEKIYQSVMNKKDYTNSLFKKDYGIKIPKQNKENISKRRLSGTERY